MKPTLVVMAAGMGSRYGGLKQIDSVGPTGERIIDYSLYDAARAGFGKVVFIIRRDIEQAFRGAIEPGLPADIPIAYAFQEMDDLPAGYTVPPGRTRPWGTGHAILCCRDAVNEPFGVINADDLYGRDGFEKLADGLRAAPSGGGRHVLVAYRLANTLSDFGPVSRGVCTVSEDDRLRGVVERTSIRTEGDHHYYEEGGEKKSLMPDALVSMNMWGFTPDLFARLETAFREFLAAAGANLKTEFFIPTVVDDMISKGMTEVIVASTSARWMGMTYPEDRDAVRTGVASLVEKGEYPCPLW